MPIKKKKVIFPFVKDWLLMFNCGKNVTEIELLQITAVDLSDVIHVSFSREKATLLVLILLNLIKPLYQMDFFFILLKCVTCALILQNTFVFTEILACE